jgi:hypothetical protein
VSKIKNPTLDELLTEARRLNLPSKTATTKCELCAGVVMNGYCLECGGPFERFAVIWREAMETSSQRLDACAVRYLIGERSAEFRKEFIGALQNWVEARRMRGVAVAAGDESEVQFE